MSEIHGKVRTSQSIGGKVKANSAVNGELDKDVKDRLYRDYNLLHNKPSIEDVELKGNRTLEEFGIIRVLYDTCANWDAEPTLMSQKGTAYVYEDWKTDTEGNVIPGIKLGDGTSYLIDMPFLSQDYEEHIQNMIIHVTQEDKDNWNNKVRCYVDDSDPGNLIFTTH